MYILERKKRKERIILDSIFVNIMISTSPHLILIRSYFVFYFYVCVRMTPRFGKVGSYCRYLQ